MSRSVRPSRGARVWYLIPLLALLIAGLAAASGQGSAHDRRATKPLVVGALLDLKSGWTSLGRASRVTLNLAAADANARLAKSGSPLRIRLKILDPKGDPKRAAKQLRQLAAAGVRIVIGPGSSAEVSAVRTPAGRLGVVIVSQGSTSHSLARQGDNVFRLVPDDRREAEALVALLKRDGVRAVAPIWRNDAGNVGLAVSLRGRFRGTVSAGVRYGVAQAEFAAAVAALHNQVAALQTRGAGKVAVYLAGFDEVVDLFRAAAGDALLNTVPWYGSDGVALTSRLVKDPQAAAFAAARGYPNPILGLDARASKRSSSLRARVRAKLGRVPDAFALTTYDALQIVVRATEQAGRTAPIARLKRQFVRVADGYEGVTGRMVLNAAGDRAYGSYDFWSVCKSGRGFSWQRTYSYVTSAVGRGHIVKRAGCATR